MRWRSPLGTGPLVVAGLLFVAACSPRPWNGCNAPKTSPDVQFRTGVEVGYEAWLWHCYQGERILITQSSSACFGTGSPRVSRGPCGQPLPAEASLDPIERRHEMPESVRWPNSTPESWQIPEPTLDAGVDARPVDQERDR